MIVVKCWCWTRSRSFFDAVGEIDRVTHIVIWIVLLTLDKSVLPTDRSWCPAWAFESGVHSQYQFIESDSYAGRSYGVEARD